MSYDNIVLILLLKARIVINIFLVRTYNEVNENDVVMKVVEVNYVNTLEIYLYPFCTNIILKSIHQ